MRYAFIFLGIVLFAQPLTGFAQFTADYQTNVISSGVTSNWNGNYYVGDTTVGDVLLIETGGALILSSSGYGYVGNTSGASNNVVLISGSGSLWKVPITLSVGGGSCNSLVISNEGRLVTGWATIGFRNASASNRVSVIGSGSVWTNSSAFSVGEYGGPENELIVSNGARVVNRSESYLGRWQFGSYSRAVVTGDGSLWTNTSHLTVGGYAPFNTLIISDGGRVVNDAGYLGRSQPTATNNSVVVTGSNSIWISRSSLNIGLAGVGNSLIITNGGTVVCNGGTIATSGNRVLVSDSDSVWSNSSSLIINGVENSITVSNGGLLHSVLYLGFQAGTSSNRMEVTGTGRFTGSGFIVGQVGSDNEMVFSNGATVTSINATIGYDAQARGNKLVITGTNTTVSFSYTSLSLYVGTYGKSNGLVVADGARFDHNWTSMGHMTGADGNWVLVTGPGTVLTNWQDFYVGNNGVGCSLTVSNGGNVFDRSAYIGNSGNGHYNTALVADPDSTWVHQSELVVGNSGGNCSLAISNGGSIQDINGTIGNGSSTNTVAVTGASTTWRNLGNLIVGNSGDTNTLFILDCGTVIASNVVVGANAGADDNRIVVEGGNLIATNSQGNGTIDIRRGALSLAGGVVTVNSLSISNGASVTGSGTINGSVLLAGTLVANGVVVFNNAVTNNGVLNLIHGDADFHSTFVNNGIVLTANDDFDGDGMSNLQEDQAGTDPLDSRSRLAISAVAVDGNDVRVTWQAIGGKSYMLQTNSTPDSAGFADFSTVIDVPGSGETNTNYVDIGAAANFPARFYRVRLVP